MKIIAIDFLYIFLPVSLIIMLFIPALRHYLDQEMVMKMLVQIPALTILSFIIGLRMRRLFARSERGIVKPPIQKPWVQITFDKISRHGSSALVFLFGAQTFWMLPRSLDLTVTSEVADIAMHLNLIGAGFLFGVGFKHAPFVLKTAFSIYGLSMALSMGIIYIHFNALICAVYTIDMQHVAGRYTLYVFPFVFILFLYRLFYNMSKLENTNQK